MKTTNNKLLDNTGNPVSNNRPTIKLVEWEVRTKSDFLLWNSPDDTAIWDGERTGKTREVERPMNDTEYIEHLEKELKNKFINEDYAKHYEMLAKHYEMLAKDKVKLEKENQELKDRLRDRDYSDKNYQAYLKLETEYQCLLANNNELKGRIALQQSSYEKKFRELNDKLLKVVKTVLDDNSKEIEYGQISNSQIIEKINMELLKEEIKNAMEKGKHV